MRIKTEFGIERNPYNCQTMYPVGCSRMGFSAGYGDNFIHLSLILF